MNDGDQPELPFKWGVSRADQIYANFVIFHITNPQVWKKFKFFTFDRINRGFKNYGAGAIFERIRWDTDTPTTKEDDLKLCNDYRAYYARMFHIAFPQYDGFFRNRKLRSQDYPGFADPGGTFVKTDPPVNEAKLYEKLKDMYERTKDDENKT